jgi:hypothetical protein
LEVFEFEKENAKFEEEEEILGILTKDSFNWVN